MTDVMIAIVIVAILSLAGLYILRAKKKGRKCIGCPDSNCCSGTCPGCQHK